MLRTIYNLFFLIFLLLPTVGEAAKFSISPFQVGRKYTYSCKGEVKTKNAVIGGMNAGIATIMVTNKNDESNVIVYEKNLWQRISITYLSKSIANIGAKSEYSIAKSSFPKEGGELEMGKTYTAEFKAQNKDTPSPYRTSIAISNNTVSYNSKALGQVEAVEINESTTIGKVAVSQRLLFDAKSGNIVYHQTRRGSNVLATCELTSAK